MAMDPKHPKNTKPSANVFVQFAGGLNEGDRLGPFSWAQLMDLTLKVGLPQDGSDTAIALAHYNSDRACWVDGGCNGWTDVIISGE